MENFQFIADSKYAMRKGPKFKGIKLFKVENDIVTIECGDGRKFESPINEVSGTFHTMGGIWGGSSIYQRSYKLKNAKNEYIKLKVSDWEGFRDGVGYADDRRIKMFDALESSQNCKSSILEKIEVIIGVIAIIGLVIYFLV